MAENNADKLDKIAIHVAVLNDEVGKVQNDISWVKKIIVYMATIISAMLVKSFF